MSIKAVIFDIEGTVCPISFVKEVLYPYALKKSQELLPKLKFPLQSSSPLESHALEFPEQYRTSSSALIEHIKDLTARDVKAPYLKSLQGYLWKSGYDSGEIKVDIFPDAATAIKTWGSKLDGIYIYSSGSVAAQKLLFAHTDSGDLNKYLKGYFDTVNAGPKLEKSSYEAIAKEIGLEPRSILFFSDNPKEIEAADDAGWRTAWTIRPGNDPVEGFKAPGITVKTFPENITTLYEKL